MDLSDKILKDLVKQGLQKLSISICVSLNMAVPKRKTSKSKRDMRRSHHSLKMINIIDDKESGEPRLSHRLDLSTGMYNGKQIIKKKEAK